MSEISIIIPAHNSEETIENCINSILLATKNVVSEIIVVDDNSTDNTSKIVNNFKEIKLTKLKINCGAGAARNAGADLAKYKILCFVDSDIIIAKNSIQILLSRLIKDIDTGAVLATQRVVNLNKKDWTSNFVCLKSCYGFESTQTEIEFSVCCSEFCVISKELFNRTGKWTTLRNAGGEEFDMGLKINNLNKKNIKLKSASYEAHYQSLYKRFINIVDRTEKYLPVFLKKKKFDSLGSFATFNQAFSSLITSLYILLTMLIIILNKTYIIISLLIILFVIQLIIEFRFLVFSKKYFGIKMLLFSIFGIQIINLGIFFGFIYFIYNKINVFKK